MYILRIIVIPILLVLINCNLLVAQEFFVSPEGSDQDPGTLSQPFKTFSFALSELKGGETLILLDGKYLVSKRIIIDSLGENNKLTKIKAHHENKAYLIFDGKRIKHEKLTFRNSCNVLITGLNFTSTQKGSHTSDILLAIRNSSNVKIVNNQFKSAYEEGLKVSTSKNILVRNNYFNDFEHEGIDFLNVRNSKIINNTILEVARVGIMVKGGSENITVKNNRIVNKFKHMFIAGITIGGSTGAKSARSSTKGSFEAYNIKVFNNIIEARDQGEIKSGVSFLGANNSILINNYIYGVQNGITVKKVHSKRKGWETNTNNNGIYAINNEINSKRNIKATKEHIPKFFFNNRNKFKAFNSFQKEKIDSLKKNFQLLHLVSLDTIDLGYQPQSRRKE